jgi:hypothetical protein
MKASRDGGTEKMGMVGWPIVYPFQRCVTDGGMEKMGIAGRLTVDGFKQFSTDVGMENREIVGWLTVDGFERSLRVGDRELFGCFEIGGRPLRDRDTELNSRLEITGRASTSNGILLFNRLCPRRANFKPHRFPKSFEDSGSGVQSGLPFRAVDSGVGEGLWDNSVSATVLPVVGISITLSSSLWCPGVGALSI